MTPVVQWFQPSIGSIFSIELHNHCDDYSSLARHQRVLLFLLSVYLKALEIGQTYLKFVAFISANSFVVVVVCRTNKEWLEITKVVFSLSFMVYVKRSKCSTITIMYSAYYSTEEVCAASICPSYQYLFLTCVFVDRATELQCVWIPVM